MNEQDRAHGGPVSRLAQWAAAKGLSETEEDFWRAPDGVRLRYAHWRAAEPVRGVACILGGRTEYIEKNLETCRDLVANGFDVWSFDWRGQGLSDRVLPDRHRGHIDDYQAYLLELDGFVRNVTDLPERRDLKLMIGHSMGGHIGLRYLHDQPGLFDLAAFSAPMVDIPVNLPAVRWLNGWRARLGLGSSYAALVGRHRPWHQDPADPTALGTLADYEAIAWKFKLLTSDVGRAREIDGYVRQLPALALGGPTTGWLQASFESIAVLCAPGYAEAITTPVLIVGAGQDRVVVTARQAELAARMPNARFHLIAEAAHEILVENDRVRAEFFAELGALTGIAFKLRATKG